MGKILILFAFMCISCQHNSNERKQHENCKISEIVFFSNDNKTVNEPTLLLPKLLCNWYSAKRDTPCCKRDIIISEVDKNYNTTLFTNYLYGSEIDIFTDNTKDFSHFHKIIELKFSDSKAFEDNKKLLEVVKSNLPAFKTENKGTLAWRLKPIAINRSIFLIFSNTQSKYTEEIKNKLDSITKLR